MEKTKKTFKRVPSEKVAESLIYQLLMAREDLRAGPQTRRVQRVLNRLEILDALGINMSESLAVSSSVIKNG